MKFEELQAVEVTEPTAAKIIGITASRLAELRREGKLSAIHGTKPIKYNLVDFLQQNHARMDEGLRGRAAQDTDTGQIIDPTLEAALLNRERRKLLTLKIAEVESQLVSYETLRGALIGLTTLVKQRLLTVPDQLASRLHGLTRGDMDALESTVRDILDDFVTSADELPKLLAAQAMERAEKEIDRTARDKAA